MNFIPLPYMKKFCTGMAVLSMLFFVSCGGDDPVVPESPKTSQEPTVPVVETVVTDVDPLDHYAAALQVTVTEDATHEVSDLVSTILAAGSLDSFVSSLVKGEINSQVSSREQEWSKKYGRTVSLKVRGVKYTYASVDQTGKPIILSSYATWAFPDIADTLRTADHDRIYLYCPYTLTQESGCSTATLGGYANALVLKNSLVVSPDYQGFGSTHDTDQMYLNHELSGRQIYDAMAAAYMIFRGKGFSLSEDWHLAVMGMSQGAANAVAVQKYMETTEAEMTTSVRTTGQTVEEVKTGKLLSDWWHYSYTSAACGPYSPVRTMDEYLSWTALEHPSVIPLVVKSMVASYPSQLGSFGEAKFFSERYDKDKAEWDSLYVHKLYTTTTLDNMMFAKVTAPGHESYASQRKLLLSDLVSEELLDAASPLATAFRACLSRNDLTSGWTPAHHIFLYAAKKDEYVPYGNTEALVSLAPSMVHVLTTDTVSDHSSACTFWLVYTALGAYDNTITSAIK